MLQAAAKNILLTGPPGCGKTTVVRHAVELLKAHRLAGFYTAEVREHGQRVGFEAIGLGGRSATLAHVGFPGPHRVGRYGVNFADFEAIIQAELTRPSGQVDLFAIDEIGKMECLSPSFVKAVIHVLDGPAPVLATVAAKGSGFIAKVKEQPDIEIVTVTATNRDRLPDDLAQRFLSA